MESTHLPAVKLSTRRAVASWLAVSVAWIQAPCLHEEVRDCTRRQVIQVSTRRRGTFITHQAQPRVRTFTPDLLWPRPQSAGALAKIEDALWQRSFKKAGKLRREPAFIEISAMMDPFDPLGSVSAFAITARVDSPLRWSGAGYSPCAT
jgi:hypothetical protein